MSTESSNKTEQESTKILSKEFKQGLTERAGEIIADVIVVGGGPAGLTAAIYTAREGLDTVIVSGYGDGQLASTPLIENFPGFPDGIEGAQLVENMKKQSTNFGAQILEQEAIELTLDTEEKEVITDQGETIKAKAIIIATGINPNKLGVPGEEELWGKGVSTCATCDAPFYKNKSVAIVGGGNSAFTEALHLSEFAEDVQIVNRGEEPRASKVLQDRVAANPNIKVKNNTNILQINGDNSVESISLLTQDGEEETPIDGVFIAIGSTPNDSILQGQIKNEDKTKSPVNTSIPGVFIAGDLNEGGYKQAITAAAQGAMAGIETQRFLSK